MLEAFVQGLAAVLQWNAFSFMLIGVALLITYFIFAMGGLKP